MLFFGAICVLFVVLIGRLMYIEYTSGEKYEKIVLSQQNYDSEIIPFQRGDIVDSKGTVLATSVDVYNVVLDCKVLNEAAEQNRAKREQAAAAGKEVPADIVETTIYEVTRAFPEITEEAIRTALTEKPDSPYVVLAKQMPYASKQALQDVMDGEETAGRVVGIWFEKEYIREYPYGSLAAAMLGFSNSRTGVIGLENEYDEELTGVNGRSYGYQNEDSDFEKTVVEPEDGNTVMTTIDVNVQTIVEKAIRNWNKAHITTHEDGSWEDGSQNTAVLVMRPNTGEVLAMATYPTFNLNDPKDLSRYFSEAEISTMSEEEQMDFLNKLWQNFTITSTYEPGSTAKPFTVATGLETGTITGNETYYCDGFEQISDYKIHCFKRDGHGMETVAGSLYDSCNDALMQMSYVIGAKNFSHYQSVFGFGQRTHIDLPGEASTAGLLYSEEELEKTVNIATNSFGQNFNVTMVQLASAFCSLINGGNLYQPHVVSKILDKSGNVIESKDPIVVKKTISEEVSAQVKEYLLGVVRDGTGKSSQVEGYNIGGKTGTAEKLPRSAENYLVSFIGFAPYENPEVVVYVVVDVPNVDDQAHSSFSQEIGKNIMEQILPYLNVKTAAEEAGTVAEPAENGETAE